MSFTVTNWACISDSLNQGQLTITPFGGSPTIINAPNVFIYGKPTDTVSQIITVGYFNPVVTELSVGDWIIGNGSDASFIVFVESIVNDVVTVAFVTNTGTGTVTEVDTGVGLTGGPITTTGTISLASIPANTFLSNITGSSAPPLPSNSTTTVEQLGLGRPGILILTDADFASAGGTYLLTNPPPIIVSMSATSPGRVLQLPPQNEADSLQDSNSIELLTGGNENIGINNGAGVLIFQVSSISGNGSAWRAIPNDRTTVGGAWEFLGEVQTINGLNADVSLISSDNSVNINGTSGQIDFTVSAGAIESLQNAYDNGNTIAVESSRPLEFSKISLGVVTNGVATPSTGTNNSSNWFVRGITFVPSSDIYVTSFQVEDSTLAVGQTRTLGIYEKSTQNQLLVGNVSKTDSLVGVYRTKTVSSPVLLTSGVEYVLSALVPPTQIYRNSTTAVAGADLSITEFWTGPTSATQIPLSFPDTVTVTANEVPYGAFQYQTFTTSAAVEFTNDSNAVFMQATSTTQANIPAPVMTDAQFAAIPSPQSGMMGFTTTTDRLSIYDGTTIQKVAYISDIPSASYTPTLANVSGTSLLSLDVAFYNAVRISAGNIVTVTLSFTYTATATTGIVNISIPLGNNFSSAAQAALCGGSFYAAAPNIGDGVVLDITSVSSSSNVQLSMLAAVGTGIKTVNVSFMYQIQ